MDVMISVTKPELSDPLVAARWQRGLSSQIRAKAIRPQFKKMTRSTSQLVEIVFDSAADPVKLAEIEAWAQQLAV